LCGMGIKSSEGAIHAPQRASSCGFCMSSTVFLGLAPLV
jgi:hypothetical protein